MMGSCCHYYRYVMEYNVLISWLVQSSLKNPEDKNSEDMMSPVTREHWKHFSKQCLPEQRKQVAFQGKHTYSFGIRTGHHLLKWTIPGRVQLEVLLLHTLLCSKMMEPMPLSRELSIIISKAHSKSPKNCVSEWLGDLAWFLVSFSGRPYLK